MSPLKTSSTQSKPVSSMTGFASAKISIQGNLTLSFEAKSLNGRFLDLKPRLPRELSSLETNIRSLAQGFFERGNIELKVEYQKDSTSGSMGFSINEKVLAYYFKEFKKSQKKLKIPGKLEINTLIQLPEVVSKTSLDTDQALNPESVWKNLEKPFSQMLAALKEMRIKEGKALQRHLQEEVKAIQSTVGTLQTLKEKHLEVRRQKTNERVTEIFEAYPIRESNLQSVLEARISQELALLIDRTDVQEELTRLHGHTEHFLDTLQSGGAVGRKLEFLLQEMHREVNTLGTKAQDFNMSEVVVQLKVKVEQIKEQVLNIE